MEGLPETGETSNSEEPMKTFVFALLLAGAASAQSVRTFQVPGCTATAPAAINDLNEVVGTATCGGLSTAFIRDAAGHFTTFTIDGKPTTATGINIHGAVVGSYSIPDCNYPNLCILGYVRSLGGVVSALTSSGQIAVLPVAINESGQIGGTIQDTVFTPRGFLRDVDGIFTVFPVFPQGFKGATVTGLTDDGAIAGAAFQFTTDIPRAVIRAADGTVTLVGPPFSVTDQDTWVIGIDRLGANLIGYANFRTATPGIFTTQGFMQTATGLPKLFPVPFTAPPTRLTPFPVVSGGINSHGAAVLSPAFGATNGQAIYIAPDGAITVITIPDCAGPTPQAINDNGWVTGSCTRAGQSVGFLWRK
jgi:hypothetical protein